MTSVRPTLQHPLVQPSRTQQADPGRLAAQRAFFDIVAGKAASAPSPVQASAPPAAAATAPVVRKAAETTPAEAPAKLLRPGSLLDIRV